MRPGRMRDANSRVLATLPAYPDSSTELVLSRLELPFLGRERTAHGRACRRPPRTSVAGKHRYLSIGLPASQQSRETPLREARKDFAPFGPVFAVITWYTIPGPLRAKLSSKRPATCFRHLFASCWMAAFVPSATELSRCRIGERVAGCTRCWVACITSIC
jgi:hypothetical protein